MHLVITTTLHDLENQTGVATTATGTVLPVADVLALAARKRAYLLLFDHNERPLLLLTYTKGGSSREDQHNQPHRLPRYRRTPSPRSADPPKTWRQTDNPKSGTHTSSVRYRAFSRPSSSSWRTDDWSTERKKPPVAAWGERSDRGLFPVLPRGSTRSM